MHKNKIATPKISHIFKIGAQDVITLGDLFPLAIISFQNNYKKYKGPLRWLSK